MLVIQVCITLWFLVPVLVVALRWSENHRSRANITAVIGLLTVNISYFYLPWQDLLPIKGRFDFRYRQEHRSSIMAQRQAQNGWTKILDGLNTSNDEKIRLTQGEVATDDDSACFGKALRQIEPVKLQKVLQAFGTGLLDKKPTTFSAIDEQLLHQGGRSLSLWIQTQQKNRNRLSQQTRQIKQVGKIKELKQLKALDPAEFEYWTAGYFQSFGFKDVMVTTFSGDFGVDVHMTTPNGKRAVVQCKRYSGQVGRPTVQQTYGVMKLLEADICYVVTSGRFTQHAAELGERRDIVLLDGEFLVSGQRPSGSRIIRRKNNQG